MMVVMIADSHHTTVQTTRSEMVKLVTVSTTSPVIHTQTRKPHAIQHLLCIINLSTINAFAIIWLVCICGCENV